VSRGIVKGIAQAATVSPVAAERAEREGRVDKEIWILG
jgi:hypothetical protein